LEWQTDVLASPADNAQVEGDDPSTFTAINPTVRLGNYTQILRKELSVSGTANATKKAGRGRRELAYQLTKLGKELRLDVERMCVGQNTARSAGSASTPRRSASVLSWIKTNTSFDATSGADPVTADGAVARTDSSATRAFTEAHLKEVLAEIWSNSDEDPDILLVGAKQKQVVSTFTGNATRFVDAAPERLYAAIDRYVGDFSAITIRPDRVVRARDALLINTDLWKLAWLRPISIEELAKTGDTEKRMMIAETTLESRNERGSGGIFDLS